MIYSLTGKVALCTPNLIVIDCGGVGYACKSTLYTLEQIQGKDTATLYTYMAVRDDAVDLFGFATQEELECFKLLTSVNGVGSTFALAILSSLTSDKIALAIASQDSAAFTKVKGIGSKIAQRICMELKDKIAKDYAFIGQRSGVDLGAVTSASSNSADAIQALVVLGYTQSESASAISQLDGSLPVDELIRKALIKLAANKF